MLSLRYDIEFNLIAADNNPISANIHGGSKPPPYTGKVNLMLNATTQYHAKSTKDFILCDFCAEQGASTMTYEYTSSAKQRSYAQKAPKLRDVIEFEVVD